MKILVVNAGSSSLKFTMFRTEEQEVLAKGLIERIGLDNPNFKYENNKGVKFENVVDVADHPAALELVCNTLVDAEVGVLANLKEIEAVGHRVVHGGESFTEPAKVDAAVKEAIKACFPLAPLHNPPNLGGIEACEKVCPGVPNVAVFDTAFHQTMEPSAYRYPVPEKLYKEMGIRKYGFHGTSHKYVYNEACKTLGLDPKTAKVITCHMGNGSSLAAINGGKVVDTTMGMTPLAGIIMGTRSGDIDPGVVLYLINSGYSADEVDKLLNKESGLLAISPAQNNDMRDLVNAVEAGDEKGKMAMDMYIHRLIYCIGGYYALLGGVDAIVFTGGIGENSKPVRKFAMEKLAAYGVKLDEKANDVMGEVAVISEEGSAFTVIVMPTDEELMIALETENLIS